MRLQSHDIMEFARVRENRRSLARIDGARGHTEIANSLLSYAHNGGRVILARNGDVVAGCFGYSPVTPTASCYSEAFMQELGSDAKPVFRHNIWVRPEFRGQGLSRKLFDHSIDDARGRGYTHSVGFMPETETIAKWARSLPGVHVMSAKDKNGGQIVVRPF